MLKLNYIIVDTLPEYELKYLQRNLNIDKKHATENCNAPDNQDGIVNRNKTDNRNCTEDVELPVKSWQFILLSEQKTSPSKSVFLMEFPPEESLFISSKKTHLQKAALLGMATLGYLPPEDFLCEDSAEEVEEYRQDEWARRSQTEAGNYSWTEDKEGGQEVQNFSADMYAEGMEEIDYTFLNRVYERHHNIPWTILETERCIVREFSMDYLDELFEMYAGDGMTDYMEPLFDYEEEKEYQQAYIKHMYRFYGYGMWIVCDKQTGRLIGRAGIEHREELDGELELGYAIAVPYQRQGYATEVCQAILRYVAEQLEFPQISCLIESENENSIHFAEKLGFSFDTDIEISSKSMKKYMRKWS